MRILGEIEGKESGNKLRASTETLRLIGPLAAIVPDIAGKDVIVLRLSDIVQNLSEEEARRNAPLNLPPLSKKFNDVQPPPLIPPSDTIGELTDDFYKRKNEFMKDLGNFTEKNGFEKSAFLALNIDNFYARLNDTAGYAVFEAKNKIKNKILTVITIPDQPLSDDTGPAIKRRCKTRHDRESFSQSLRKNQGS